MRGDRRGSVLRDFRLHALNDRKIHIGRGKTQFAAARLQQDIGQDRDRRTPFDNPLYVGEGP